MPSWLLKASIQGAISLLPFSHDINYLFQRHVTRGLRLTESHFEEMLGIANTHVANFKRAAANRPDLPAEVIELGTGWQPVVPIALSLCGFDHVLSVDINDLIRPNLVKETLDCFIRYAQSGRLSDFIPIQPENVDRLAKARDALETEPVITAMRRLNIDLLVADARRLPLEPKSVDTFISNNTFEHIPPPVLQAILVEFRRVAKDTALMSHRIDLSDHYSHADPAITPYHFLRYSSPVWRLFNNRLAYQNRLRVSDYRAIHQAAGFHILHEDNQAGTARQIEQVQLAESMRHYRREDLTVITSWMVSAVATGPAR